MNTFTDEFGKKAIDLINEKLGHEDTETWFYKYGGHEIVLASTSKVEPSEFDFVKGQAIELLKNTFDLDYACSWAGGKGFTLSCD